MPVSTDDFVSVTDFLGRYCWLVDAGDEAGWAALWAQDGVFTGIAPERLVGHDMLKAVPRDVKAMADGKLRHLIGSLHCDYAQGDTNTIIAKYYNFVTSWLRGGNMVCIALSTVTLTRNGLYWLIF